LKLCDLLILCGFVFGSSKAEKLYYWIDDKCMFGLKHANTSLNQKFVGNFKFDRKYGYLIENMGIL